MLASSKLVVSLSPAVRAPLPTESPPGMRVGLAPVTAILKVEWRTLKCHLEEQKCKIFHFDLWYQYHHDRSN